MKSPENILLVDDDVFVRQALRVIINRHFSGAVVTEAETVADALKNLEEGNYDLLILDLSLGTESGLSVIHDLKARDSQVPVLVLSSQRDPTTAVAALRSGARGFLTKTDAATSHKLVEAISKMINGERFVSGELAAVLAKELDSTGDQPLSQQENRVLFYIAEGKSVKEIAHLLAVSEKSVRTYRTRLLEKLGLTTDGELIRYALQHGLVR